MSSKKRTKKPRVEDDMENLEDVNMNEVTDSEDEYTETEKKLLKKVRTRRTSENYDSDYEVYGLRDENDERNEEMDEDEDDEEAGDSMESDIEGLQDDFDLPDERAWGKKKKAFYSTDYVDADYASASQKDLAEAEVEEQEARSIQKRLAEQLDDADFGLDLVQPKKDDENDEAQEDTEEIVKTDLSKLSKRQKQAIVQKESPEFMSLVNDFKVRMTEAKDVLAPFLKLVESDSLPDCSAVSFVKTKYHLSLNYCVNISFYLMLKAKRLSVNSHPVIKRLAQYRQLLNQLESGQENLMEEIADILKAKNEGKPLYNITDGSQLTTKKSKKSLNIVGQKSKKQNGKKEVANVTPVEVESKDEESEEAMSEEEEHKEDVAEEEEEETQGYLKDPTGESEGKRAITYQMAKNRGLTPYRKKELRNPRVKHRNKYRKAKIRRKGAVREVRKETSRYAGEISGIKAGVKKSVKLK